MQTNNNAIVALTLGILSFLIPFIGLILGIIGLVFSRKATKEIAATNEKGGGMATAGLITSIVGLVMQLLMILSFIAFIFLAVNYDIDRDVYFFPFPGGF